MAREVFEHAAFYGGTALRMFHGLRGFSEDLDFSLQQPVKGFDPGPYLRAVLCRKWKTRVKGRDYYDFVFHAGRQTPCRLAHLEARLRQTGHWQDNASLGQRFRQHLKLTPSEYILQRRLEYAKELLRAGELSVAQISDACHFHDCSYFCKIFKRATGTSPSALQPKR